MARSIDVIDGLIHKEGSFLECYGTRIKHRLHKHLPTQTSSLDPPTPPPFLLTEQVVENLLDMLHISYVHTFGNMQEPLPFAESYDYAHDDEASQLLPYARTTFK